MRRACLLIDANGGGMVNGKRKRKKESSADKLNKGKGKYVDTKRLDKDREKWRGAMTRP